MKRGVPAVVRPERPLRSSVQQGECRELCFIVFSSSGSDDRPECLPDGLRRCDTAVGSYPQWAMQLSQRGSLPRPYFDQSVVSISSL